VCFASALSLEPYGLSLPISMSSCSIADRQSPTLLSVSSGLSGESPDLSHKGGYVDTHTHTHTHTYAALFTIGYTQMHGWLRTLVFGFSTTTLKLDGVKRVWGREGYLSQSEPVEEPAHVEVPSPLQSPSQQGEADRSHSQTPTPTPQPEQEKQQLASSLFVGLGSQSSVCLVSFVISLRRGCPV